MLPDEIPLDYQLCFALHGASMAIGRAYKPLLDALEITYPQYLVLSTLWERGAQTVGAIADRLALESSTVTPLVKRLEQADFVVRNRNPEDERQVVVGLAAKGTALREKGPLPRRDSFRRRRNDAGTLDQPQQRSPRLPRRRDKLHQQDSRRRDRSRLMSGLSHAFRSEKYAERDVRNCEDPS